MAVLTGRSGQLFVDGARVARCAGWSLDEQRPMLDNTPLDSWNQTVVPGRRGGTGSAKVLYDPEDTAAATFFDSILLDTKGELGITLPQRVPHGFHATWVAGARLPRGA